MKPLSQAGFNSPDFQNKYTNYAWLGSFALAERDNDECRCVIWSKEPVSSN